MTVTVPKGGWRSRAFAWGASHGGRMTVRMMLWLARRPDQLERLTKLRHRAGDLDGAVSALEEAITRQPTTSRWYVKLGRLHERAGRPMVQRARVGLIAQPGDWHRAADAYRRGTRACPESAELQYRLGRAELQLGRSEQARDAFARAVELAPEVARHHAQLGRAIHADYTERGGTRDGEVDEELAAYRRALELDPGHRRARERLLDTSVRQRRWGQALDAARTQPPASLRASWKELLRDLDRLAPEEVSAVLAERFGDEPVWSAPVPTDWWYALHARLIDLGEHLLAYRAKDAFAGSLLADDVDAAHAGPHRIERARALGYLGNVAEARTSLDPARHDLADLEVDELLARKVRADLALLEGETSEVMELDHLFREANHPTAEARFAELITDRDVAIVGPSEPVEDLGAAIDAADTVIRPKLLNSEPGTCASAVGARTDIAYYGTLTSGLVLREIDALLERDELKMAVFRASRYREDRSWIRHPGDLRYMPAEYGAMLRAVPFGIQRIVYDVLRYRPASVRIFHADLFTGPSLHRPGYSEDQRLLEERGLARIPLSNLAHDHRADFVLLQALFEAGTVQVRPNLERLLRNDPEGFLRILDGRQGAAPAEPASGNSP